MPDNLPVPTCPPEIWSQTVATKKTLWFAGKILTALLTTGISSPKAMAFFTAVGVPLTPVQAQIIAATIVGSFLTWIHDYAKVKLGWAWL